MPRLPPGTRTVLCVMGEKSILKGRARGSRVEAEEGHHAGPGNPSSQGQPAAVHRAIGPGHRSGAHHGAREPRLARGPGARANGGHAHVPRALARARAARAPAPRGAPRGAVEAGKSAPRAPVTATPDMEVNDFPGPMPEGAGRDLP